MGGGGNIVNTAFKAAVDPIGSVASAITGDNVNLSLPTIGKRELYDKPKEAMKAAEDEMRRQQDAYDRANRDYQNEQTAEKKRLRDIALSNLQRAQARARMRGSGSNAGAGGTILTSPLGVPGDTTAGAQKTLLGS